MFGYNKSYDTLLAESALETHKDRHAKALAKFLDKSLQNPDYEDLFPRSFSERSSARTGKKYQEYFARTQKNSPIFTMRQLLNNTIHDPPADDLDLDLTHIFTEP